LRPARFFALIVAPPLVISVVARRDLPRRRERFLPMHSFFRP